MSGLPSSLNLKMNSSACSIGKEWTVPSSISKEMVVASAAGSAIFKK